MDWLPKKKEIVEEFDINPPDTGKTRVIRSKVRDETDGPPPPVKPSGRRRT